MGGLAYIFRILNEMPNAANPLSTSGSDSSGYATFNIRTAGNLSAGVRSIIGRPSYLNRPVDNIIRFGLHFYLVVAFRRGRAFDVSEIPTVR